MQKISSYLYPNRINVVADVAVFPVRWNIVYQNRVKIYKGVDNLLTIDVKNAEQKRIDISAMDLKLSITDINGQGLEVFSLNNLTTTGLATVNIPADSLINIDPQFLKFTIYRVNSDTTKTILYADTQFGAMGNMELVGDTQATAIPPRYITRWLEITNDSTVQPWIKTWYSDAVEIKKPNYLTEVANDTIDFEFIFKNLDADITVQFTKDPIINSSTDWISVDNFIVDSLTSTLTRTYSSALGNLNREYTWARIIYVRTINNTGKIDKVIVRL